jgi:hypothetical protein
MAQSDELMKGFQVGYQNAPFASLGQAIKSTIGRLQEREDTTAGLVTKAGIESMFRDPLDSQYKKAQIENISNESADRQSTLEANRIKDSNANEYRKQTLKLKSRELNWKSNKADMIDRQKNKDTTALATTLSDDEFTLSNIENVLSVLPSLPSGGIGKLQTGWKKIVNPNDPMLANWQKVKTELANLQLSYTDKTKGAISDKEMDFFRDAVANDDLMSLPRIAYILNREQRRIAAKHSGMKQAYSLNYGDSDNPFVDSAVTTDEDDLNAAYNM